MSATPLFKTTVAGSLPKPFWLAEPEKLWAPWRHEGAELESTWNEPKDRMLMLSVPIEKAPNRAAYIEVNFEAGVPVGLNGKKMDGIKLIDTLNRLGGKHGIGQVRRVLGDKIDAHALGADQAYHLLDLLHQCIAGHVEQQMRFVEEKHQPGFVGVTDLGQLLEQLRDQP